MLHQIINDIIKDCPVCSKLKRPTQVNCKKNCWARCSQKTRYFDQGVSPKYINYETKDFLNIFTVDTVDDANLCLENVNVCLDFCESRFSKKCIKLSGNFKGGKDFLANTMIKSFIDKNYDCLNLRFPDVIEQAKKGENLAEVIEQYGVVGILDVGCEYSKSESKFVEKTLLGILNKLSFNCTKTIVTTHLSLKEIYENYGPQVHEIFDSDYIGINIVGKTK